MKNNNEHNGIVALSADEIDQIGERVVGGWDHSVFVGYGGLAVGVLGLISTCIFNYCRTQTQAQQSATINNVMGNNNRGDTYKIFILTRDALTGISASFRTLFANLAADVDPANGMTNTAAFATSQQTVDTESPAP